MRYLPAHYVVIVTALLLWTWLPEPWRSGLFLPLWGLVAWLIFTGCLESARLRRATWLGQYLLESSPWHRLLRGGVLMVGWNLLLAIGLGLLMLVKLSLLPAALWAVLLLAMPLLAWLTVFMHQRLQAHVKPSALAALGRRLLVPVATVALMLGYLLLALALSQPDMIGLPWDRAMAVNLDTEQRALMRFGVLERLYQLLDLTLMWALQNTLGDVETGGLLAILGWSLLLLTTATFLWAWVRVLVGSDALLNRREKHHG